MMTTRASSPWWRGFLLALVATTIVSADREWPQCRGAKSGVAADDAALPETWSATQNVAWKLDLPGRGWSSPIVTGDHVFVTSAVNTGGREQALREVPAYT